MTKTTPADWFFFANNDVQTAEGALERGVYSMVCFLSQQAVEKSLKACLVARKKYNIRTHSLMELYKLVRKLVPSLDRFETSFQKLDKYYAPTRYPDALPGSLPEGLPTKDDAEKALAQAQEIFTLLQKEIKNLSR